MSVFESFRVAFGALFANRLRSILTMLGIIIGVGAVVSLVSLGQSFQDYIVSQFNSIGSNMLFVASSKPSGPNGNLVKVKPLTMDDAAAISNPLNVPGLEDIAPSYVVNVVVVANGNSDTLLIYGSKPSWENILEWHTSDGRFIDDNDVNTTARVAVVGTTIVTKLFGAGADAIGQEIRINGVPFHIIGVLTEKGGLGNQDETIVVPITTAQSRLGDASSRTTSGAYSVSLIYLQATSKENIPVVKGAVENLLRDRHKVEFQGDEDFQVVSLDQVLGILTNITGLITAFLAVVAGISLLVGGIGVMNIMLVSVTERTREIGLRKALGARRSDLMSQFLIESVVLTVTGGSLGVLIGALVAFVARQAIPSLSAQVTLPAVILATGVSTAVGVFFGFYPASRAAALNPIEALHYE
jgi:putative ABC transport system permease protein